MLSLALAGFPVRAAPLPDLGAPSHVTSEVSADFDGDGHVDKAQLIADPAQESLVLSVDMGSARRLTAMSVHLDGSTTGMRLETRLGDDVRCPNYQAQSTCGRPFDIAPGRPALVITAPKQRALIFYLGKDDGISLTLGYLD
ncbi:hypothetical protein [Caulobacter sp. DWP3-1-3b2]|uniref:hypothetical protein n=1 Tax=Caulobacter sp. DWP3-1-3b2 TaxID=2804643 RepID=UPI003CEC8D7A